MELIQQLLMETINAPIEAIEPQPPVSIDPDYDTPLPVTNNPDALDVEEKYAGDIAKLARYYGIIQSGQTIEISLKVMLHLCPRKRRRIDAYDGLCSTLRDRLNIRLIIKSQKSDDYEEEEN